MPNFLTEEELAEIRATMDEAIEKMVRRKIAAGGDGDFVDRDGYYDKVFLQRLNLWKINDTIRRNFLSPELVRLLCELAGVDGIRIWHDQALQKQPWANPTAWHIDNPYWSFHSTNAISIWIALDDATVENGCMYYLPGSHRIAGYEAVPIGENIASLFDVYP